MANPESRKLMVDVVARISTLEKQMAKAKGVTNKNFGDMEKRGKQFQTRMAGIGKAAFAGFTAGIAGVGVGGAVAALRQVASSVADISNEAARAGVTTRVFQEWQAVAVKARIPMDALTDAFKELNIRGDEFAQTAKGSAAEAFARLGLTPAEVKERLKDPAELMLLLIDRTRQLKDTAAATRIFDELFGGTGAERLVSLLGQSTDEIRATIKEAHTLGNVLDDNIIKAAEEVDKKFNQITHTVGQNLRGAIVSAYTALQDFINAFNGFEAQRSVKLDEQLALLGKERLQIEKEIGALRERQRSGQGAGDGIWGTSLGESTIGEAMQAHERRMEAIAAEEGAILKVLEARRAVDTPAATGTGFTPTPYTPPSTGGGGRDKAAAQAEREAEAVRRLIGELEHELRLVGATDLQRETANALRQAGAAATAEQEAKIISLVAAIHAEEEATRKATEAAQELRDVGRDVLGGFINDMVQGKSAADALASALQNVANRLLNSGLDALFGLGGGGGHMGGLFTMNYRSAE
ncbi:MAG: hypothetical protein M9895_05030 [Aquamicrobium sp.]|uniref:hypothetical protein n=1 Tax=Aquamicrobium sp. TaxID=1872579 RepID=UPI00349EF5E0|nr:hypothetical protein [Aquamicrobium sp.]MCO5158954.1 hypothetical protein [Aquamicrobium sp.]